MNENEVRELFTNGNWTASRIGLDNSLFSVSPYVLYSSPGETVDLSGTFSSEEIEALLWWMKNKSVDGTHK